MTVASSTSRSDYTGNGVTTAFTGAFRIFDQTHIIVYRTQISTGAVTTLALTTDYTVSGVGGTSFTVTCLAAPTSDQRISILRNVPLTQVSSYPLNDVFPSTTTENALDKLTMQVQQLNEAQGRALTVSPNSVGVSATLPSPSANQIIGWNGSASGLTNYNPTNLGVNIYSAAWRTQTFNGDGVTAAFVLAQDAGVASNCDVSVAGVAQTPDVNYSYNSTTKTITFLTGAPPSGTNNVVVRYGQALPAGTVAAASITDSTAFGRSVITAASATAAGLAVSGANSDITALNSLAANGLPTISYDGGLKSVGASVAANALTVTLAPCTLQFRGATLTSGTPVQRAITGTLSLTVPSSATLGTVNAVQSDLYVLAIDNAGTVELAIVNASGGVDLSETGVISTTAISAGSTSASTIYSTSARTNVAYRVAGLVRSTQATAGTWATAPSLVQGAGGQALMAMSSFGFGQTWQNVTGSRVLGTTYYNTTGKPICLFIYANATGPGARTVTISGVTFTLNFPSTTDGSLSFYLPVPNGAAYSINASFSQWNELR